MQVLFHGFAINFFHFVTSLNPGIYYLQYYVNDLRYLLPFPAISVTFFSSLFHFSSEFLIFFCNCLLHFPIATYKTLALYLCSHRFQKFFRVRFAPERVLRLRNRRNMIVGAAIGRPPSWQRSISRTCNARPYGCIFTASGKDAVFPPHGRLWLSHAR